MPRPTKAVLALCALLALGACAPEKPEATLAKAKDALAREETSAAVVLLKDVLQREPQLVEARLLLGRTLLQTGDPVGALAQFDKAIEQGAAAAPLALPRARAQLLQGKYKVAEDALDTLSPDSKLEEAERLYLLGLAHSGLSRTKAAEASIRASLALNPESAEVRLMLARVVLSQGRTDEGLKLLADFQAPKQAEPERRTLYAMALSASGAKAADIRKAFEAVLELTPNSVDALGGLASLHLREGEAQAAKSRIADIKRLHPKDLRGTLLQSLVDAREGRTDAARDGVIAVLKVLPDNLGALTLAGRIALLQRDWTMAETHLAKALSLSPDSNDLRAVLGRVYLEQGNSEKALATVMPRLNSGASSSALLSVAATALLERGQPAQASALFSKALATQSSEDERLKIAVLQSQLGVGDQGLAVLGEMGKDQAQGATALMALLSNQLRRGQSTEALATARQLQAAQPDRAMPHHLEGQILLGKGESAAARLKLEQALKLQPEFMPSLHMLAALDLAQGNGLGVALARYDRVLKQQPGHVEAGLAQVDLCIKAGDETQGLQRLKALAANAPGEIRVRATLINHHASRGRLAEAEQEAAAALKRLPNQPELIDLLGRAQFSAGKHDAALETFRKLGAAQPHSPLPLMRQADALAAKGAFGEATNLLTDAARLAPRDPEVLRAQVMLAIRNKNFELASSQARGMQASPTLRLPGLMLEGDVELARQRWREAAQLYRRALEVAPGLPEPAIKAHQALQRINAGEAETFAQAWAGRNPGALAFHIHLGNQYAAVGDYAKAEPAYVRALAAQPDSTVLANNVAWVRLKLGRTDGLELLQSVVARDPLNAEARDTLAAVQELGGQREQALRTQLEALRLAPDNTAIRLRAVSLLHLNKKNAEALKELQPLAAGQVPADLRAEFTRLTAALKP